MYKISKFGAVGGMKAQQTCHNGAKTNEFGACPALVYELKTNLLREDLKKNGRRTMEQH